MDDVLDLRDSPEPWEPSVEEVVAWLRRSQGGLDDRLMRATAADLLERAYVEELEEVILLRE